MKKEKKECIAMLLAGGQGSRLRVLTKNLAKPAVPFGGQYRIIDFSLSNCTNSNIDTVGVLTQYKPQLLNSYVGNGSNWDLSCYNGGVTILPPYVKEDGGDWYKGTAHAVYQNLDFIEKHNPQYVLILSGDHIYKMDYSSIIRYHAEKKADITISVIEVPWEEAQRFGIMEMDEDGRIIEFEEKPENPKSNLASMGIYVFNCDVLKECLFEDALDPESQNDFGKNVIPRMLKEGRRMYGFAFPGYWRDVGTIESYWSASMDILEDRAPLDMFDRQWCIYSMGDSYPPHYMASSAQVRQAMISEGCSIYGQVEKSIIFPGVIIGTGARVRDSVIMSAVKIGNGARIEKAIIGENTLVGDGAVIGGGYTVSDYQGMRGGYTEPRITVVEENTNLPPYSQLGVLIRMKRSESKLSEAAGG